MSKAMFGVSAIRRLSTDVFISPRVRSPSSHTTAPLYGVKILAMHDSPIVKLLLQSLAEYGAEIVDVPMEMSGKVLDEDSQVRRNILVNLCRKTDLLIEGFPKGKLEQNDIVLDHLMKNNGMMVTARLPDNLYTSVEENSSTPRDNTSLSGHLGAMTKSALSSITMALFDAQRSGSGTMINIDAGHLSQHFPHLQNHNGSFRRFYKARDGKWLFIGSNDLNALSGLFKKLRIQVPVKSDSLHEQMSELLAAELQKQPQHHWQEELADSNVIAL